MRMIRAAAALLATATAAGGAASAPSPACTGASTFGTFGLQCGVEDGRNLCTLQYNGDPNKGFRVATRSLGPGDRRELTKVQAILMFAAPQLNLAQGQRPAVEIQPGRNSPVHASGTATAPHIVGVKSDVVDLTFWAVGEPPTMTWKVKVDGVPLVYSFPRSDFLSAFNAMTGCQIAYARKHGQ